MDTQKNDFRKFCLEVALGVILILVIIGMANASGWFRYHERNAVPAQLWAELSQSEASANKVFYLGNSHTKVLNPKVLDSVSQKKTYCLGYPAANLQSLYWLLYNALDYSSPEYVVLETHTLFSWYANTNNVEAFWRRGRENKFSFYNTFPHHLDYMPWTPKKIESVHHLLKHNLQQLPVAFGGSSVRNHDLFEVNPFVMAQAILKPEEPTKKYGGFVKSHYVPISDSLLLHYNTQGPIVDGNPQIEKKNFAFVEQIKALCDTHNVQLILYESPMYHKHYPPGMHRFTQLDSIFTQMGLPFINLNTIDSLVTNPGYFENTFKQNQHLTPQGADAVSEALAQEVLKVLK